jgi:hypothetical protein
MAPRIPIHNGVPDWDCAGALAIPEMAAALEHVVKHGEMPVCPPSHSLLPYILS